MRTQIIVEVDAATARELEAAAPSRKRQRSEFIRAAIRRSLDEVAERRMAEAYRDTPDTEEPAYFDPAAWEATKPKRRR